MLGERVARLFLWVILLGIVTWGGLAIVEKSQKLLGDTDLPWAEYLTSAVALGFMVGMVVVGVLGFVWAGRFIGLLRFRDREMVQVQADIAAIKKHMGIP